MIKRILVTLLALGWGSAVWAIDVNTIVSCKADGEVWLCAAWRGGKIEVFRSENYITKVEFSGAVAATPTSPGAKRQPAMISPAVGGEIEPKYTLQLLACNSDICRQRMAKIDKIPGSRILDIKNEGKLWQILVAGEFASVKAAQQAAGDLMVRYQLRDKPWVRSLESIRRREVRY